MPPFFLLSGQLSSQPANQPANQDTNPRARSFPRTGWMEDGNRVMMVVVVVVVKMCGAASGQTMQRHQEKETILPM
ncbi:hypothetical protein E2C01_043502 [Portunus trituberculatus]|uniref:Uncharacterized protein n=1 Tax=Portunus trituberculatus TaxID=210409 RepID=A0A5B7FPM6_PORTR|nr:hypothetical protein [Portunus trituberculatus]